MSVSVELSFTINTAGAIATMWQREATASVPALEEVDGQAWGLIGCTVYAENVSTASRTTLVTLGLRRLVLFAGDSIDWASNALRMWESQQVRWDSGTQSVVLCGIQPTGYLAVGLADVGLVTAGMEFTTLGGSTSQCNIRAVLEFGLFDVDEVQAAKLAIGNVLNIINL